MNSKLFRIIFISIISAIVAALVVLYCLFLSRRIDAQKSRILFITDKFFDDNALRILDKDLKLWMANNGFRMEKCIIDTQTMDVAASFARTAFLQIEKQDSAMIVFSPFMSLVFSQDSNINITSLHYKPIIVGLYNSNNNEAFDFMFDMNNSSVFKDCEDYMAEINKITRRENKFAYFYSTENKIVKQVFDNIPQESKEKFDFISTDNGSDYDLLKENGAKSDIIFTAGFNRIADYLYENKGKMLVLPYWAPFFEHGFYCVLPDIVSALETSIDNYNSFSGCKNYEIKYFLKKI